MIPGSANPLLLRSAAATGYQIQRSLRFNSSDSAFLSRTPASAGNRKTWTWAGWVKRSKLGEYVRLFNNTASGANAAIQFMDTDKLRLFDVGIGLDLQTTQVFRDASAWYHFVIVVDTTQATSSNRAKFYVNGSQITTFSTSTYPSQNTDGAINNNVAHQIGSLGGSSEFYNGCLADVIFVDGQALDPSSFTEVSATTGQLIPKAYTGSFGTNGFWLKFSDNSAATATTLGKDYSGNNNNFTPNNFSVLEYPRETSAISNIAPNSPVAGQTTFTFADSTAIGGLSVGSRIYQSNASIADTSIAGTIKQFNTSNPNDAIYGDPWDGNTTTLLTLGSLWIPSPGNFAGAVLTPTSGVPYSSLRVYARKGTNGTVTYGASLNGGPFIGTTGAITEGWIDFGGPGTLTSLRVGNSTTLGGFQPYYGWAAIELNGQILIKNLYSPAGFVVSKTSNQVVLRDAVGTFSSGQTLTNPTVDTINRLCDSTRDTPTSAVPGSTSIGNYCTFNPLLRTYVSGGGNGTAELQDGNLVHISRYAFTGSAVGTIQVSSGKYYWEVSYVSGSVDVGIAASSASTGNTYPTSAFLYQSNGNRWSSATSGAFGSAFASNSIIGVAVDMNTKKIWFSYNGIWQGSGNPSLGTNEAFSGIPETIIPFVQDNNYYDGSEVAINFGQRNFLFSPPSGFSSLCDTNLPAPVVAKPNTVFDVVTWVGNQSSNRTFTLPGSFSPDLIWFKNRSTAAWHQLYDTIRGTTKRLFSNATDAENTTDATYLTSFDSSGFTIGSGTDFNGNGQGVVAWTWDAGTTTSSNGSGSITSQVRANASAGFSIVTYTGTGANATVGHGLGVAAQMVIVKRRNSTGNWAVWHKALAGADYLRLNTDLAKGTDATYWNSTVPTSTVFSVGTSADTNANGGTYVAYCFTSVTGYSLIGEYSSGTEPFVYCGFMPKFIVIKRTASGDGWAAFDSQRTPYNVALPRLELDKSQAESGSDGIDFLSNGFKIKTTWGGMGGSLGSGTMAFMAFAENPFQYARAR